MRSLQENVGREVQRAKYMPYSQEAKQQKMPANKHLIKNKAIKLEENKRVWYQLEKETINCTECC